LPNIVQTLFKLCNSTDENFIKDWEAIKHKFIVTDKEISHKRVSKELERSENYIENKRQAGIKSGLSRRKKAQTDPEQCSSSVGTHPQLSKGKVKERKGNNGKDFKGPLDFTADGSFNFKKLFTDTFRPQTSFERNTLNKLAKDYAEKHRGLKHAGGYIIDKIEDLKLMCREQGKSRTDFIKIFVSQVKKEMK
jgi:hypothetical protein